MENIDYDIFEMQQIRTLLNTAFYNLTKEVLEVSRENAPEWTGTLRDSGKISPQLLNDALTTEIEINYSAYTNDIIPFSAETLQKLDGGVNYAPATEYGLMDTDSTGYDYEGNMRDTWTIQGKNEDGEMEDRPQKGYIFQVWDTELREYKNYYNVVPIKGKNGGLRMLRPQGPKTPLKPEFLKKSLEEVFTKAFTQTNGLVSYSDNWSIQGTEKENL